jgi:oligopeptide/dipeptide ABC transporter ATP-binding protein
MASTETERETRTEAQEKAHENIIELQEITARFEMDRGSAKVLDEISIGIQRDSIIGVVGESGSGKSMFAAAMLDAVEEPGILTGDITYYPEDGEPVNVLELSKDELRSFRWEEVSMVFQGAQSSFNPTMSIEEHFEETIRAHDKDVEDGLERARQLLSDVYLDPDRVFDSYPHELSGGMQQRALIALSLILEPELLIMDEPTAALDLLMQRSITQMLDKLQEKYNLTIVFITHDLPLVTGLADRLAVMYAFGFVETGPKKEVLLDAAHPYTRALLRTVPNVDLPLEEMQPIEGDSPDPVAAPDGCSYHPRCPLATEECRSKDPSFFEIDKEHTAACYHWERAADTIPYTLNKERDHR